jgi:hypothetical protein
VWLINNRREDYRISWGRKNVEHGGSIRIIATSEVYKVLVFILCLKAKSLLFNCELDDNHYDALLPGEKKKSLGNFDKVCFYRQPSQETFLVGRSTSLWILLF